MMWKTTEKRENKVKKVSKARAVKYKDQENASRRERADLAKAAKSFAAGQWDVPRDRFQSRDESAPHGLFLRVKEGTCSNADWTLTLVSSARPGARNVFHQTNSV